MSRKLRVLVIGGCVSRDVLNHSSLLGEIDLVDYIARSSFSSMFAKRPEVEIELDKIQSRFQRRMVVMDIEKEAESIIKQGNYDILLVDFIVERLSLYIAANGGFMTVSNELRSSGIDLEKNGQIIKSPSEHFLELWIEGWKKFLSVLRTSGYISKLRINEVFYSNICSDGKDFSPRFSMNSINTANSFLSKLYSIASEEIRDQQIYRFSPKLFVGDENHRWGKSPFHYTSDYYSEAAKLLLLEARE